MEYKRREEVPIRETGGVWEWGGVKSGKPFINSALLLYPGEFMVDVIEGRQALINYAGSTFFDWKCGSRLLFWRWSPETRMLARNGQSTFRCGPLPVTKRRAQKPKALVTLFYLKICQILSPGVILVPTLQIHSKVTLMSLKWLKG